MKLIVTSILLIISIPPVVLSQIPNADFEQWSTTGLFEEPNSYATSNTIYLALDAIAGTTHPVSVFKSSDAQTGSFALRIKNVVGTQASVAVDTLPGFVLTGNIEDAEIIAGFPISVRPTAITGFYQFKQGGTGIVPDIDTAGIVVGLSKYNEVTNTTDSVGGVIVQFYESVNSYTAFSEDIVYVDDITIPDTAYILITSSIAEKVFPGSELIVDALSFDGVMGIEEPFQLNFPVLYPNPVEGEATITNIPSWAKVIRIADSYGRQVFKDGIYTSELRIDLKDLPTGLYFYYLESENSVKRIVAKFSNK